MKIVEETEADLGAFNISRSPSREPATVISRAR